MKRVVAEKYRDIDFSRGKRGAVVKPEPGETKISIRLVVREDLGPSSPTRRPRSKPQRKDSAGR